MERAVDPETPWRPLLIEHPFSVKVPGVKYEFNFRGVWDRVDVRPGDQKELTPMVSKKKLSGAKWRSTQKAVGGNGIRIPNAEEAELLLKTTEVPVVLREFKSTLPAKGAALKNHNLQMMVYAKVRRTCSSRCPSPSLIAVQAFQLVFGRLPEEVTVESIATGGQFSLSPSLDQASAAVLRSSIACSARACAICRPRWTRR
jgi:hypothetical protein